MSSIFQFQQLICVFTASPYTASQTHKKYKYAFPFTKTTTYTNRTQITQKCSFTDTYHPATSSAVPTTMRISRRRTDYENRYHGKSYRAVTLEQSAKQSSYQMLKLIQGPSRSTAYSPLNWQLTRCPSIGAHDLAKTATKRLSKQRLHRGQVSDRRPTEATYCRRILRREQMSRRPQAKPGDHTHASPSSHDADRRRRRGGGPSFTAASAVPRPRLRLIHSCYRATSEHSLNRSAISDRRKDRRIYTTRVNRQRNKHERRRRLTRASENLSPETKTNKKTCVKYKAPFTRYSLLSNRLSNPFDNRLENRLYRVYKHSTGCMNTTCLIRATQHPTDHVV